MRITLIASAVLYMLYQASSFILTLGHAFTRLGQ